MEVNIITQMILNAAYKVHSALGPGLLESSYQACMKFELEKVGLQVELEKSLPLIYEEIRLDCGHRIDMLIEKEVIVEFKTVEEFTDVHIAQILTYLKLSKKSIGLLINFNTKSLKNGIKRVIL